MNEELEQLAKREWESNGEHIRKIALVNANVSFLIIPPDLCIDDIVNMLWEQIPDDIKILLIDNFYKD